jgi:DNA polymerase-4
MERVILHVDLNNYYASVECFYNPEIRDKAVAVCGSQEDRHGIVLAKNYIAKNYGIRTGEATWEAKRKCPELVTVPPNFDLYIKISRLVRDILKNYSDRVENFGIDENWLDITASCQLNKSGRDIAEDIQKRITLVTGLTTSIGISFNKIFSKLGSDMVGKNEIIEITKDNFKSKVWPLPVPDLLYVGPSTRKKLFNIGILTIGNLANSPLEFLKTKFGKCGETLWVFANGYDRSEVAKFDYNSVIKGMGNSLTSPKDLTCDEDVKILIYLLTESVAERLRANKLKGKTVQIWIKDKNFKGIVRQSQLYEHTYISYQIAEKAFQIFKNNWNWNENIRAFGVRVTNLIPSDEFVQISMFEVVNIT